MQCLCSMTGYSFLDPIGQTDIAYIISLGKKNGREMWDQDMKMIKMGLAAHGEQQPKLRPLFTGGKGKKKEL
jgi:hypothetical protein